MKSKKYGKILAALLCAGLLAGWHAPPVFAVDITVTVTEENQTEIQGTFELADKDIDTAVTDKEKESVAIGTNAEANGKGSTAIGYGAKANHNYATVVGNGAKVNNNYATALGYKAYAGGLNSVAIGYGSRTSQFGTVSFGYLGENTIGAPEYRNLEGIKDVYVSGGINFTKGGVGSDTDLLQQGELRGVTKISFGSSTSNNTTTYTIGSIVFDNNGQVTSINGTNFSDLVNTDLGSISSDIGSLKTSVGEITSNVDSIEKDITDIKKDIGNLQGSSGNVDGKNIKPGSVTMDKVTVGDATTSTTTMDGSSTVMTKTNGSTTSTTTTEAGSIKVSSETTGTDGSKQTSSVSIANGDIELSKTGADGKQQTIKVGEEISSIRGDMDSMRSDINAMGRSIDRLGEEIDEVGALSAALAGLHPNPVNANSRADFAMAVGSYDGESAIAAGAFYRPDKRTMLSLGASATSGSQMFNVGVTFALDKLPEKPAADSEVLAAVMARLEKLEAENAQLRAQYAELKEQTAQ